MNTDNGKPSHRTRTAWLQKLAKRSRRSAASRFSKHGESSHGDEALPLSKNVKRSHRTLLLTLFPMFLIGCIGQPLLGPFLAAPRSMVRLDESTEIRWLDADQMREPPIDVDPTVWQKHLATELPETESPDAKFLSATLLPLAPIAAGLAIDALHAGLVAESKLYAAQFSTTSVCSDFWQIGRADDVHSHLRGFELRRTTRDFDGDQPAFVLRVAIVPASDPRLLLLRPIFFQTRAARAKLLLLHRRLETRVDLALTSIRVDRGGAIVAQPIGSRTFRIADYDLSTAAPRLICGQTIAVLPSPPLSIDASGRPLNPVLVVHAVVTERDAGRAQESFEQLSQRLADDRAALIAATTQPNPH